MHIFLFCRQKKRKEEEKKTENSEKKTKINKMNLNVSVFSHLKKIKMYVPLVHTRQKNALKTTVQRS